MSAYDQIRKDLRTDTRNWHEVTEDDADWMLTCVPPIRHAGRYCFQNSEPYTHTAEGKGVYYTFLESGGKIYGIMATTAEWDSRSLVVGQSMPKLETW